MSSRDPAGVGCTAIGSSEGEQFGAALSHSMISCQIKDNRIADVKACLSSAILRLTPCPVPLRISSTRNEFLLICILCTTGYIYMHGIVILCAI